MLPSAPATKTPRRRRARCTPPDPNPSSRATRRRWRRAPAPRAVRAQWIRAHLLGEGGGGGSRPTARRRAACPTLRGRARKPRAPEVGGAESPETPLRVNVLRLGPSPRVVRRVALELRCVDVPLLDAIREVPPRVERLPTSAVSGESRPGESASRTHLGLIPAFVLRSSPRCPRLPALRLRLRLRLLSRDRPRFPRLRGDARRGVFSRIFHQARRRVAASRPA